MRPLVYGAPGSVILDEATTKRVLDFVRRTTFKKAAERLGIGEATLDAARDFGRMKRETAVRIIAALDREDAALEKAS